MYSFMLRIHRFVATVSLTSLLLAVILHWTNAYLDESKNCAFNHDLCKWTPLNPLKYEFVTKLSESAVRIECNHDIECELKVNIKPDDEPIQCMTFRYLAIPNYSSVLGVNVEVADGSKELAWLNTGYSIQQWVEQQVQLNFTRKSYTGLTIVSDLENLWLNRVRFSSGLCPSTNPCTFDQATFCEWNDVSTDLRYKFETIRKEESLHRQFPRSDARFNIHSGRYLALNHQLDAKTTEDTITMQTKQAVLVGPVLDVGKTHSYCLRFKLWRPQKYGPNLKVVLVGLIDDEIKATYWNLNKIPYKMMNEWQQMEVAVLRPMAGRIGIAVSQSFISDSNALALDDLELLPGNCVPAVDCPFNVSLCGYYPANFQSLPFTLGDGSLEDEDSLANRLGRPCVYANFPTPVDSKLEIYIFEMKSQWRTPNRYVNANCLQFEFVVLSESKDSSSISESINSTVRLRIGIENAQNQYTLFEYEATNSNGWQKVEVSIQESNTFRVQVLAERVSGHRRAVIGLANMKAPIFGCKKKIIQSNKDPKRIDSLSCDFAVDLCGWKQRHAGQWRIQTRHETNQDLNFALVENVDQDRKQDLMMTELESPLYEATSDELTIFCAQIDYAIGVDGNPLAWTIDHDKTLMFETLSAFRHEWSTRSRTFSHRGSFRMQLTTYIEKGGSVRIRRIHVFQGHCERQLQFSRCDFESDSCGFSSFGDRPEFELIQAKRISVPDPYGRSVSFADHTRNSGEGKCWAMQINHSDKLTDYDYTELAMFDIESVNEIVCVEGWMAIDAQVTIAFTSGSHSFFKLDQLKPDSNWYPFRFQYPIFDKRLELKMEVHFDRVKSNWTGFAALDDVIVRKGTCDSNWADCDFETQCLWENGHFQMSDWQTEKGIREANKRLRTVMASDLSETESDHTLGTSSGSMLMFDGAGTASYRSPKVVLQSYELSRTFCFGFSYKYADPLQKPGQVLLMASMDDPNTGLLQQKIKLTVNATHWQTEYISISLGDLEKAASNHSSWEVWDSLQPTTKTRSLILYLFVQNGEAAMKLLLDDFQLLRHSCPNSYDHDRPMFRCRTSKNDEQIDQMKRCDGIRDCSDGSDEVNCGECSFDQFQTCGYTIIDKAKRPRTTVIHRSITTGDNGHNLTQFWNHQNREVLLNGFSLYENQAPDDMLVITSVKGNEQDCVRLLSPVIHQSSLSCHLQFTYANIKSQITLKLVTERLLTMDNLYDDTPTSADEMYAAEQDIWMNPNNWTERVLWQTTGDHLKTTRVSVFLGQIVFPARLVFEVGQTVNLKSNELAQVLLSNITKSGCDRMYYDFKSFECGRQFDCMNGRCIDFDFVCDQRNDCVNGYDEQQCDYDRQGIDFDSHLPDHIRSDGWQHTFANEQTAIKAIQKDHSNKMAVGALMWMSTSIGQSRENPVKLDKLARNQDESIELDQVTGFLQGFHLHNMLGCRLRMYYILKGGSAQLQLITHDWLQSKPNRYWQKINLVEMNPKPQSNESTWNRVDVPLNSANLRSTIRLRLQVQLNGESGAILIDDLSFTRQCYATSSVSLQSLVTPKVIVNQTLGEWSILQMDPLIRYDQSTYEKPYMYTLASSDFDGGVGNEMVAVFRQRSPSLAVDKITEGELKSYDASQLIPLTPSTCQALRNGSCVTDLNRMASGQSLVIQSPYFLRVSGEDNVLVLLWGFVGSGWGWLQLLDVDTGLVLYEKAKHNRIGKEKALIPLRSPLSSMSLQLKAHFDSSNTRLAIQEVATVSNVFLEYMYSPVSRWSQKKSCDFDFSEACNFVSTRQPSSTFVWRATDVVQHPDHTLGSIVGSYLLAGCGLQSDTASSRFTLLLNTKPLQTGWYTISFWYTNFWKTKENVARNSGLESLSKGGIFKVIKLRDESEVLFDSSHTLHGRWARVSMVVRLDRLTQVKIVAAMLSNAQSLISNEDFCLAIDDLRIRRTRHGHIQCFFNERSFCGWTNDETIDRINWMFVRIQTQQMLQAVFDTAHREQSAILKSSWFNVASVGHCFKFMYKMVSDMHKVAARLQVEAINEDFSITLHDQSVLPSDWRWVEIDVPNIRTNKAQQLIIKAELTGPGSLATNGLMHMFISNFQLEMRGCSLSDVPEVDIELKVDADAWPTYSNSEKFNKNSEHNKKLKRSLSNELFGVVVYLIIIAIVFAVIFRADIQRFGQKYGRLT